MTLKIIQTLISCSLVCGLTLDDLILVNGHEIQEMTEKGKIQYQLLQERGTLPQFGSCWTSAIDEVHEGCKHLSEETQSDIALHLTNCFLQMSGHETYNCVQDKKQNLRGICINTMSDRAFNVYTEFYTHALNMCWFLRGQVWQETITENTYKVGKQLDASAKNQETLLKNQQETLRLQESVLNYSLSLQSVLEKFYVATLNHQEVIETLSMSVSNLHTWLIGEISWFDTILFYTVTIFLSIILTAIPRTSSARFSLLVLVVICSCLERVICTNIDDYKLVWLIRKICLCSGFVILMLTAYFYRDKLEDSYLMLKEICRQNNNIIELIKAKENYFDVSGLVDQGKFLNGEKLSMNGTQLPKNGNQFSKNIHEYLTNKNGLNGAYSKMQTRSLAESYINKFSCFLKNIFKTNLEQTEKTSKEESCINKNEIDLENVVESTSNPDRTPNYSRENSLCRFDSYESYTNFRYTKDSTPSDKENKSNLSVDEGSSSKYRNSLKSNISRDARLTPLLEVRNTRYNFRSRQNTPDLGPV